MKKLLQDWRAALLRIRALVAKEFRTLLLDPSVRRILVVPILAQSILFGYGATFNLDRVPYVFHDASRSAASAEVLRAVEANGIFECVGEARSAADYERAIDGGRALVGIRIPEDFTRRIDRGETPQVMVTTDARNTTTANIAAGYVSTILSEALASESAVRVVERFRFNENGYTRYGIMTGLILGLSMIQVMLLASLAVSREREEGSFDMLLMTPLSPGEILLGKAAPPVVIGLLQGLLIFLVCRFWFEIPFAGSLAKLAATLFVFNLSLVGAALVASAVTKTLQQSVTLVFVVLLPSLILSGLMTPVGAMPEWLQTATLLNPVRHGIEIVRMIYFENASWSAVLPRLAPIAAVAALTMPTAAWCFRNRFS